MEISDCNSIRSTAAPSPPSSSNICRASSPAQPSAVPFPSSATPPPASSPTILRSGLENQAAEEPSLLRHASQRPLPRRALEVRRECARYLGQAARPRQRRQGSRRRRSLPLQVPRPLLRRSRAGLLHAPHARPRRRPHFAPASRPRARWPRTGAPAAPISPRAATSRSASSSPKTSFACSTKSSALGMSSRGSGADNIRNITASPSPASIPQSSTT